MQKINLDPQERKSCPIVSDSFADSLGALFASSISRAKFDISNLQGIPLFSLDELETALKHLNNLRAVDESGI